MVEMWSILAGVVMFGVVAVKGDAEVMSHVTAHFGKSLEECREESGLSMEDMAAFHHFWDEDYPVVKRELGCAIICMASKFSLFHDDTKLHHDNMEDYIKSFPNGEILSEKMVLMIHECEKQFEDESDDCERVVHSSACFKEQAKLAGIAPELAMIEAVLEQY